MPEKTGTTESKVRIIEVITHPLAFYALIGLIAEAGLATTAIVIENEIAVIILIVGMISLLITMVILVAKDIDKFSPSDKKRGDSLLPASLLDKTGTEGFLSGGVTKNLEGMWEVEWMQYDENRILQHYKVKNKKTGIEEKYPKNNIEVKVHKSVISASAFDETTRRIYYLGGRISIKDTVTLLYWSKPDTEEAMLVGVLLLQVDWKYENTTMSGPWIGYDRETNAPVDGTVTWSKLTID